ncbi:alpha/beta hydrolase [Edaphobacter aggregans]|uniref:alpha/beta hydrolase n=1 Tax=Edaphobacter aggregans TaxID=570835 RepID=UPI000F742227|nr:alpha/beta hydrolase [Edaphobacter aggregans]
MGWKRIGTAFAVVLLLLGFTTWPVVRVHLQAIAILKLVSGQPVPRLISAVIQEPVESKVIEFPAGGAMVRARMYLPRRRAHAPALVVLHGVHHLGMNEPRLMSFAAAMASCGLQVLTPELPNIKDYHIDADSVRTIADSAQWFASQTGGPVGVMGLSFSGGLALVAAADPMYERSFKFVFAVGSQDEMSRVAQFYLTGRELRPDGTVEELSPHEYGALVLEYEHLDDFVPASDVAAVRAVLREHLYENKQAELGAMNQATVVQRAEAVALMDTNSPKTRARLAAAEILRRKEMDGLSPHGILKTMTTPVYLLHGEADNIIPSAETLWMAHELPNTALRAALISPTLSHLDLDGAKPGIWDELRLVHFFALVMQAAERN